MNEQQNLISGTGVGNHEMTPFEKRLIELQQRGDIERIKVWGKALGILHEVVKTGGEVVRVRGQLDIIDMRIQEVYAHADAAGKQGERQQKTVSEIIAHYKSVIREDIPFILEQVPDLDSNQKQKLIAEMLARIPELKISI